MIVKPPEHTQTRTTHGISKKKIQNLMYSLRERDSLLPRSGKRARPLPGDRPRALPTTATADETNEMKSQRTAEQKLGEDCKNSERRHAGLDARMRKENTESLTARFG